MSKTQTSTFTDSALSDRVKDFLIRFKDKHGTYRYVEAIDEMMPKHSKYIIIDYNDLVSVPEIEIIFSQSPDRLFDAFSRAIKEALQTRFPDYAEKIKDEVRARLINYPLERSLRKINAETIGKITSVSGMVVRASEVKPLPGYKDSATLLRGSAHGSGFVLTEKPKSDLNKAALDNYARIQQLQSKRYADVAKESS
jgi:replicative DNA helicase Mcm